MNDRYTDSHSTSIRIYRVSHSKWKMTLQRDIMEVKKTTPVKLNSFYEDDIKKKDIWDAIRLTLGVRALGVIINGR